MDSREKFQYAQSFILSEVANFTPSTTLFIPNSKQGQHLDWRDDPDQHVLDQTPGGRSLRQLCITNGYTMGEVKALQHRAVLMVVSKASGMVEVVFNSEPSRTEFYDRILPTLLRNEKVDQINGINRIKLYELYCADTSPAKDSALNAIAASLRGRILTNGEGGSEVYEPLEIRIIRDEVKKLVAAKMTNALKDKEFAKMKQHDAVMKENALEAERSTLGIRKLLPHVRISLMTRRYFVGGEIRKAAAEASYADRVASRIGLELVNGKYRPELDYRVKQRGYDLKSTMLKYGQDSLGEIMRQEVRDISLLHSVHTTAAELVRRRKAS